MSPTPATSSSWPSIVNRYTDAYRTANFQTAIGTAVKIVSIAIGVLIALIAFFATSSVPTDQPSFLGPTIAAMAPVVQGLGAFVGLIVAAVGFLFGVMISAQGQLVKASLDSAVNTSPFLTNDDRASMMSI